LTFPPGNSEEIANGLANRAWIGERTPLPGTTPLLPTDKEARAPKLQLPNLALGIEPNRRLPNCVEMNQPLDPEIHFVGDLP